MKKTELLRNLPKVDDVLNDEHILPFFEGISRPNIIKAVREAIDEERSRIIEMKEDEKEPVNLKSLVDIIIDKIDKNNTMSLRVVVNGTGTILHTNLGRAGLSEDAARNVFDIARRYSTLEYDAERGERGSRHDHLEKIISEITGAEAAMIVNNNAAATMICLAAIADDTDVIVSRGELVEIGGAFRIPEIMEQSGARLVEVGTTNKTKVKDYERALRKSDAGAILKVHTSNYKIIGFTEDARIEELAQLSVKAGIPLIYDMGSGLMVDLSEYGVHEPTVKGSLKSGADIILFSGDKLLGGAQGGIIAGKKEYIDKMKAHPLARVLRVDKMTLAANEVVFREYLDETQAKKNIPVLAMITADEETLDKRARRLTKGLDSIQNGLETKIVETKDIIGGGTAPEVELAGTGMEIQSDIYSTEQLEKHLRNYRTPIIARASRGKLCLNMRTISDDEIDIVIAAFKEIFKA